MVLAPMSSRRTLPPRGANDVMSLDEGIGCARACALLALTVCPFSFSGCHAGQENEYLANGLSPVINDLGQVARLGMLAKRHDIAFRPQCILTPA